MTATIESDGINLEDVSKAKDPTSVKEEVKMMGRSSCLNTDEAVVGDMLMIGKSMKHIMKWIDENKEHKLGTCEKN